MAIPLRGSEEPAANPQIHKPPTFLNFSTTMSQSTQKFRKKKLNTIMLCGPLIINLKVHCRII